MFARHPPRDCVLVMAATLPAPGRVHGHVLHGGEAMAVVVLGHVKTATKQCVQLLWVGGLRKHWCQIGGCSIPDIGNLSYPLLRILLRVAGCACDY